MLFTQRLQRSNRCAMPSNAVLGTDPLGSVSTAAGEVNGQLVDLQGLFDEVNGQLLRESGRIEGLQGAVAQCAKQTKELLGARGTMDGARSYMG